MADRNSNAVDAASTGYHRAKNLTNRRNVPIETSEHVIFSVFDRVEPVRHGPILLGVVQ